MPELDIEYLRTWIGSVQSSSERLSSFPANALAATLGTGDGPFVDGSCIPALWHWLYFLPTGALKDIGEDGHASRGGFLPDVNLPQRMWAGSRLKFRAPLIVGSTLEKRSTVKDIQQKYGRNGQLVFVTILHEILQENQLLLEEEHDIVYRESKVLQVRTDAPVPRAPGTFQRSISASAVLLFRYSALTFNSHRIHYDRPYATGNEAYPGLVVHGPLIASLLLDLLRRHFPDVQLVEFRFRSLAAVFDQEPFTLHGEPQDGGLVALWAQKANGGLIIDAMARIAPQ